MKKYIIISLITIFLLAVSFFAFGIIKKTKEKSLIEKRISKLPSFTFTSLDGISFTSDSITGGPILIVRFHPECEHCQYEISEILKSKIPESVNKVLLITSADRNMVIRFLDGFNISERQSVIPLLDTVLVFSEIFGDDIVPSNYIYNKDLELIKVLKGEYKIESILKYLEKVE